jgi:hypothetical protein
MWRPAGCVLRNLDLNRRARFFKSLPDLASLRLPSQAAQFIFDGRCWGAIWQCRRYTRRGCAGTGVDVIYLKENKKLAQEIPATGGAIVCAVLMGTLPAPQNFSAAQSHFKQMKHCNARW